MKRKKKRTKIATILNTVRKKNYERYVDPITGIPKFRTGRPPKYSEPEEMIEAGEQYFRSCWQEKKIKHKDGTVITQWVQHRPYTISGLALGLGMDRITLLDYEKDNRGTGKGDKFCLAVRYLKSICQRYAEEKLFGPNATGPIFNLCNNYGKWYHKMQQEISGPEGKPIASTKVNMTDEEATRLYMQEIRGK